MVYRLLTHPGTPLDGHAGSWALDPNCCRREEDTGRRPVDDSLIAILVVGMVAWEFIQFAISEKARGECVTGRNASASANEKVLESPAFRDTQKVDCSLQK
jgi:hypothetical protein